MENISSSSNHTIAASSFVPCPRLPEFLQWRKEYLTPVVYYNSVAAITINGLLLPVTAMFNALIIFSILVDRQLRRNPFMILLLSLSATDFLIGFLVQPLSIVGRVSELMGRQGLACNTRRLYGVIGAACVGASLAHICLISIERYFAVRFPNRYKYILTSCRVAGIVLLVWLIVTTYAVLLYVELLEIRGALIGRTVIIAILTVVTAAFYIETFRKTVTVFPRSVNIKPATSSVNPGVPSHSRTEGAKDGPGQSKTNGRTSANCSGESSNAGQTLSHNGKFLPPPTSGVRVVQTSKIEKKCTNTVRTYEQLSAAALLRKMREKKLAKTMLITVGFLALCYFPATIAYPLLPKSKDDVAVNIIVLSWTTNLLYFNSFINPFWYSWRMRALHNAVFRLFLSKE